MLWKKRFQLSKFDFCRLFRTERSWHAYLIFCGYCVWSAYDLPSDARAFSLTSFEMLVSPKCLLDLNNYKRFSFCPWKRRFPAMFCHAGPRQDVKFSRIVIFRSKPRRMDCSLNWSYISYGELRFDPVMIALQAMNFKLELVFLRIMWVFGHFFTCRPTWSQSETFNLIGVNLIR